MMMHGPILSLNNNYNNLHGHGLFYQLVRFSSMVVFGVMAYQFYEQNKMFLCVLFGSLALLFQPFFKIVLGRTIWNIVDVAVALLLIGLFFSKKGVSS